MTATGYAAYANDAVLSASPARLVTLLYDRLLLDLRRADAAFDANDADGIRTQLQHADRIIAELASSLRLDVWDGAERLLALYVYVSEIIGEAIVGGARRRVTEAINLLEPLRQTWHEAAAALPADGGVREGALGVA
jgi:flagellar protein FliS